MVSIVRLRTLPDDAVRVLREPLQQRLALLTSNGANRLSSLVANLRAEATAAAVRGRSSVRSSERSARLPLE